MRRGDDDEIEEKGVQTDNLRISSRAHIILPYHIAFDKLQEQSKGDQKIGTTNKGIGPCYSDKMARIGIRMCDLLDKEIFREKLAHTLEFKNAILTKVYDEQPLDFEAIFEEYYAYGQQLKPYVTDTSVILNEAIDQGERVLFEGAQGNLLDIDHGTYPFVTSSNPVAGGVTTGTGVGPTKIDAVIGVCKAYTSRVGEGPYPTELFDEIGDQIREVGREYGTTTGRPRRVGWFDSVVMAHSCRVSGITKLSLNSIDVLSGLETVKICTGYRTPAGDIITHYPASLEELSKMEPVYEELPGWDEDITGIREYDNLPDNAKRYVERISELVGAPIATVSVGPDREQTIILQDIWNG